MSAELAVVLAFGVLVIVVLALVVAWAFQTANRLDRLHVRYDLSWQALDGALSRRSVVARAVATEAYRDPAALTAQGRRLVALADAAERAPRSTRETAENELAVSPSSLPSGVRVAITATPVAKRPSACLRPGASAASPSKVHTCSVMRLEFTSNRLRDEMPATKGYTQATVFGKII